jgi:hypothetical protein
LFCFLLKIELKVEIDISDLTADLGGFSLMSSHDTSAGDNFIFLMFWFKQNKLD